MVMALGAGLVTVMPAARAVAQADSITISPVAHLAAGGAIVNVSIDIVCTAGDSGFVSVDLTEGVHKVVASGAIGDEATCSGTDQTVIVPVPGTPGGPTFGRGTAYATAGLNDCDPSGFPCSQEVTAIPVYVRVRK
jgi:hypothetical protein